MTEFQEVLIDTIRAIRQEYNDIFRYPIRMYGFLMDYHPELEFEIHEYKPAVLSKASILLAIQIEEGTINIDRIYREIQMENYYTKINNYLEVLFFIENISEKFHEWKKTDLSPESKTNKINIAKSNKERTADEWYQLAGIQKTNLGITSKENYIECLTRAAEMGHLTAMHSMALYYLKGKYVKQNLSYGINLLKQCAELGDTESKYEIFMYSKIYPEIISGIDALNYLKDAAEDELIDAQYELAMMYYNNSTNGDYIQAVSLLNKCADKGDASALYQLALCYRYGHGTKQDINEAMEYLRKAAELGHKKAKEIIGEL